MSCRHINLPQRGQCAQVVNLSQNVDRADITRGYCSCITPHGQYFSTEAMRFLLGREHLALQGLFLPDSVLNEYSEHFLADLAGNMFSSPVLISCILNIFVTVGSLALENPGVMANGSTWLPMHIVDDVMDGDACSDLSSDDMEL